jgi:hypothetical protein
MPAPRTEPDGCWYRQPVLWLGIAVFVVSMLGCVWIIVASAHSDDVPLQTSHVVFGVPASARSSHPVPR